MIGLRIVLDASGQFPEMRGAKVHEPDPSSMVIAALPQGTQEGNASISIICRLADGSYVFAENTMVNFIRAAIAFHARYEAEWRAQGVTLVIDPRALERRPA